MQALPFARQHLQDVPKKIDPAIADCAGQEPEPKSRGAIHRRQTAGKGITAERPQDGPAQKTDPLHIILAGSLEKSSTAVKGFYDGFKKRKNQGPCRS